MWSPVYHVGTQLPDWRASNIRIDLDLGSIANEKNLVHSVSNYYLVIITTLPFLSKTQFSVKVLSPFLGQTVKMLANVNKVLLVVYLILKLHHLWD